MNDVWGRLRNLRTAAQKNINQGKQTLQKLKDAAPKFEPKYSPYTGPPQKINSVQQANTPEQQEYLMRSMQNTIFDYIDKPWAQKVANTIRPEPYEAGFAAGAITPAVRKAVDSLKRWPDGVKRFSEATPRVGFDSVNAQYDLEALIKADYGNELELSPLINYMHRTDRAGDYARQYILHNIDALDALSSGARGINPITLNRTKFDPNDDFVNLGSYKLVGMDAGASRTHFKSPIELFPERPFDTSYATDPRAYQGNTMQALIHELMHARTYQNNIPWEMQKDFLVTGWNPDQVNSYKSLLDLRRNMYKPKKNPGGVDWEPLRSSEILTSNYGLSGPNEDIADYLALVLQHRLGLPMDPTKQYFVERILTQDPVRQKAADNMIDVLFAPSAWDVITRYKKSNNPAYKVLDIDV